MGFGCNLHTGKLSVLAGVTLPAPDRLSCYDSVAADILRRTPGAPPFLRAIVAKLVTSAACGDALFIVADALEEPRKEAEMWGRYDEAASLRVLADILRDEARHRVRFMSIREALGGAGA